MPGTLAQRRDEGILRAYEDDLDEPMTGGGRSGIDAWLDGIKIDADAIHAISASRNYGTSEADYDSAHNVDPSFADAGLGLTTVLRESGARFDGPAVEFGCGTGHLTLGVAHTNAYPLLLATDPSPPFVRIARDKIRAAAVSDATVRYAVLAAEDIDLLPAEEFSAVILRSCLHHIEDVGAFIRSSARLLRPGGALTFEEPCLEGFLLMAAVLRTLPAPPQYWPRRRRAVHVNKVNEFIEMVRFMARRDIDKSHAEDKHLFRVDELMTLCSDAGLDLRCFKNLTYEHFAPAPEARTGTEHFGTFFYNYLKILLGWPEDLLARYQKHLGPTLALIDEIEWADNAPHMSGVFVALRR